MADASSRTVTVTKTVDVKEKRITLVLDEDEAQVLVDIMHHTGGDPHTTRRAAMNRVADALVMEGVYAQTGAVSGNIWCER